MRETNGKSKKSPPARTSRARENQLINLAYDLAEAQLRNGTATSQVITEFLRRGTLREQLMNEKLKSDLDVAKAKIKQYEAAVDMKDLSEKAIQAMKSYSGYDDEEDWDDYDDGY